MKVIYRSFDGKEFATEDECLEYEKNPDLKMYSYKGITDDVLSCYVVEIKTEKAARDFIEMCNNGNASPTGIHRNFPGVYGWSSDDRKFVFLEPLTRKAIKEYFKDTETQE